MNRDIERSSGLMFGEFLELLRRQGFSIGIDHYLRLQELLEKTGGHFAPSDLKTLLCPIFATNRSQQELFHRTFDAHFVLFRSDLAGGESRPATASAREDATAVGVAAVAEQQSKPKPIRIWIYILTGIWLATLVMALVLLWQPKVTGPATGSAPSAAEGPPASTIAPDKARAPAAQPGMPSVAPEPERTFFQRHARGILLAAVLAALAPPLLYWRHRLRRRQLVLQKHRGKKPPYTWPVRVEGFAPRLFDADRLHAVTRHLRRRQADEYAHLDVPATVKATIEALGYPTFCYKAASRQPEYLALIDRASFRDHQAQFFTGLAKTLEREGVFITRYFFDGDPRICMGERGGGLPLSELQHAYRGHRLLLFGDGRRLIDPLTGRLAAWTNDSFGWQERALLTPTPPAQWGWTEINLANRFVLLPATVDGLFALIEHFESRSAPDLREWRASSLIPALPTLGRSDLVKTLRDYLGADALQWLCACAVYPELHWDLTLYLGSLPALEGKLLREDNLLRLIRLPWFRTGSIPDEIRLLLIRELDRDKERQVRASILSLLEKSVPPAGSVAADAYQLDLAIQRWLVQRDGKSYREMLRVMHEGKQSKDVREYALLQFQGRRGASPLDMLLPASLKKRFDGLGLGEFARSLAGILVGLRFKGLPPWLSRTLLIALPSTLISISILYAINRFWGRTPLLAAVAVILSLPPLWAIGRSTRRLLAAGLPSSVPLPGTERAAMARGPLSAAAPAKSLRFVPRRRFLVGASLILILAAIGISVTLYRRDRQLNELTLLAESVFYQTRTLEAQLVRQRDTLSQEDFQNLSKRRITLEQNYDRYLDSLGQYAGKSPVELAIMRLARRLGETDLELPPDFQRTVLAYVERWRSSSRLRTALDRARQRSLPSRIRLALDQHGLPREFMFLALQESDFDATEVGPQTRLGIAKGLWQLAPQTASEYGLAIGPLKELPQFDPSDQRHDENLATEAAARYLAYLYSAKAAGSGLLVMACYNYGQTRIIEKLDQLPNDPRQRNFWNFYRNGWIPAETRDYVMNVFSAALICEEPELFQFSILPISVLWELPLATAPPSITEPSREAETLLMEAQSLRSQGKLQESLDVMAKLLALDPTNEAALAVRSQTETELAATKSGAEQDTAIKKWLTNVESLLAAGKLAEAKAGLDRVARIRPDSPELKVLRKKQALQTYEAARQEKDKYDIAQKQSRILELSRQAEDFFKQGKYTEATAAAEQWLAAAPQNTRAQTLQHQSAQAQQSLHSYETSMSDRLYDEALKAVSLLEKTNPNDPAIADMRKRAEGRKAAARATISVYRLGSPCKLTLDDEPLGTDGEVEARSITIGRHKLAIQNSASQQASRTLEFVDGQSMAMVYDAGTLEFRGMTEADRPLLSQRRIREEIHRYQVEHRHTFGKCNGTLLISGVNVQYQASEKGHAFNRAFSSLKLTVKDDGLDLQSTDGKQAWTFKVTSAAQASEIQKLWEKLQEIAR